MVVHNGAEAHHPGGRQFFEGIQDRPALRVLVRVAIDGGGDHGACQAPGEFGVSCNSVLIVIHLTWGRRSLVVQVLVNIDNAFSFAIWVLAVRLP